MTSFACFSRASVKHGINGVKERPAVPDAGSGAGGILHCKVGLDVAAADLMRPFHDLRLARNPRFNRVCRNGAATYLTVADDTVLPSRPVVLLKALPAAISLSSKGPAK